MRVVLDTNILISALIFPGGAPEAVYRLALEKRIDLVASRPLLAELGRILTDKFGWHPGRAEEAVAQLTRIGTVVEPTETIRVIEEDPADDRVLEAASEGRAEVIVSGDRHLLRLRSWRGINIKKASAFLVEFE
ncbi:MAG: putative toxin-antitoxin system toxin component, PIN family [Actinomycetota bacterium]